MHVGLFAVWCSFLMDEAPAPAQATGKPLTRRTRTNGCAGSANSYLNSLSLNANA